MEKGHEIWNLEWKESLQGRCNEVSSGGTREEKVRFSGGTRG
jgi:hypothetical protein